MSERDPMQTPNIVLEQELSSVWCGLVKIGDGVDRPSNFPAYQGNRQAVADIAQKAFDILQAIDRKEWANRSAA